MKHTITRHIQLNDDEIKQAVVYWLKEFCDKPYPQDRDAVSLVADEDSRIVTAFVAWQEDITE